jgi:hypothetical protein
MDLISSVNRFSPELAVFIENVAWKPFQFRGVDPLTHSSYNHVHLWMMESKADSYAQIDTGFRDRVVATIFSVWKNRLRSYKPYAKQGFRLYLLESLSPIVSVVAETDIGFPYYGEPEFVSTTREVLEPYAGKRWRDHFNDKSRPDPERIVDVILAHQGSISKPAAQALGLSRAELRRWIENLGLIDQVNQIRKKFHRRPAHFIDPDFLPEKYRVYEEMLPPGY